MQKITILLIALMVVGVGFLSGCNEQTSTNNEQTPNNQDDGNNIQSKEDRLSKVDFDYEYYIFKNEYKIPVHIVKIKYVNLNTYMLDTITFQCRMYLEETDKIVFNETKTDDTNVMVGNDNIMYFESNNQNMMDKDEDNPVEVYVIVDIIDATFFIK